MPPLRSYGFNLSSLNWEWNPPHHRFYGVITLVPHTSQLILYLTRTKHIEIDVHFVRDLVSAKALSIRFISSKDQIADTFTKPLATAKFIFLRANLNVHELPLRLQGPIRTAISDKSLKDKDKQQQPHLIQEEDLSTQ